MAVRQLAEPCFTLHPNPYPADGSVPHHATREEAAGTLTELRGEREPGDTVSLKDVQVRQEDTACWMAGCDAPGCDETYEDETGGNHYETGERLAGWLRRYGWTAGEDGEVFCPACGRDLPAQPLSPAELEAAGQQRLWDGAPR